MSFVHAKDFETAGGMIVTLNSEDQVPCSELYERYTAWCQEIQGVPLSKRALWTGLKELGIGRGRTQNTRFYTGVRLATLGAPKFSPQTLGQDDEGLFIAPSDLPEPYATRFNLTSRAHRFSYYQAQGLLAAYRMQRSGDRLSAEIDHAEELKIRNRYGDVRSHPLLETYRKHMAEVGSWYQLLGLVDAHQIEPRASSITELPLGEIQVVTTSNDS